MTNHLGTIGDASALEGAYSELDPTITTRANEYCRRRLDGDALADVLCALGLDGAA